MYHVPKLRITPVRADALALIGRPSPKKFPIRVDVPMLMERGMVKLMSRELNPIVCAFNVAALPSNAAKMVHILSVTLQIGVLRIPTLQMLSSVHYQCQM